MAIQNNTVDKKKRLHFLRLTVKLKVTLWYTAFIILISIISLGLLIMTSNRLTQKTIQEELKSAVRKAETNIEYTGSKLRIKPNLDKINDCQIVLYDDSKHLLFGEVPEYIASWNLVNKELQTVSYNGITYYVYDYKVRFEHQQDIWIRGIVSLNTMQLLNNSTFRIAVITIPFLILISGFGGYLITKKALRPVAKITDIANTISSSNDLSKRIPISLKDGSKDELEVLAGTFNSMFNRLECSFEKERQFTSDASHELRTPAAVIMAQSEYILSLTKEETTAKAAESILRQTKKMSELINTLLMFARIDHNQQALNKETINLTDLCETILDELRYLAEEKKISLIPVLSDSVFIEADESMMMRLLINLITNGIKYGQEEGYVKLLLTKEQKETVIQVVDNGIGIQEDILPKIWDRFYQADPSRTKDGGSSGLGLSIVKWIVTAHNGTISVTSTPGQGTCFTVRLPFS